MRASQAVLAFACIFGVLSGLAAPAFAVSRRQLPVAGPVSALSRRQLPGGVVVAHSALGGDPGCSFSLPVLVNGRKYWVILDTGSSTFAVPSNACPAMSGFGHDSTGCELPDTPIAAPVNSFGTLNADYGDAEHPTGWTGSVADMTVGLPQSTWSIAGTSGIEGNLPVAAMSAAKGFFDTTCNLTQGIWGFGSGIKKCDTGNCIVNPLLSAFPGLPNGFALMLCGPRTGAGSYQTGGGHVWLGGADSNFMAEPFTFLSMFSDNITTSQGTTFNVGFFEANATAILVNGNQVAAINWSPNSPVILDSGTTAIILPDPLFQSVTSAMEAANFIRFGPAIPASQQAKFWSGQDYLILPCNQVYIGNSTLAWQAARPDGTIATISIDPTTVIKVEPVACSSSTDYANSTSCLRVALQMQSSGAQAGVTILGVPVLQGYVVFFDRGNSRVGFAKSIGCASGLEGSAQGINVLAGPAYVAPTVTIKVSPPVYGNNLTCFGSGDWPVPTFTSSAAPAPTGTASGKPNSATGKEVKRIAGISLLVMAAIGLA